MHKFCATAPLTLLWAFELSPIVISKQKTVGGAFLFHFEALGFWEER